MEIIKNHRGEKLKLGKTLLNEVRDGYYIKLAELKEAYDKGDNHILLFDNAIALGKGVTLRSTFDVGKQRIGCCVFDKKTFKKILKNAGIKLYDGYILEVYIGGFWVRSANQTAIRKNKPCHSVYVFPTKMFAEMEADYHREHDGMKYRVVPFINGKAVHE